MKKKIAPSSPAKSGGSKRKKQKQPTQRPEMQRVMVVGPSGKRRLEWRPW
jgi:hypothetical protein